MDQLIEIFRRLVLAGLWIGAIGFAGLIAIFAFSEGMFVLLLLSAGILLFAWVVAKIVDWIFIR